MSKRRSKRSRRAFLATVGAATTALAGCSGGGGGEGGGGGGSTTGTTTSGSTTMSGDTTTSGGTTMSGGNETTMSGGNETSMSGGNETTSGGSQSMADSITVFHAGSLAPPMEAAEKAFEKRTDIQVNREAEGSVASTQKITEEGRSADVLGVADYRLIRDMIVPKFGDWYAVFATNAMTIAYTEDSAGAGEIGTDNWWEILARDDVRFAHSDPAADPNGYRSVMSMMLGMMDFQGSSLYDEDTYNTLREKEIIPTGTETALLGQLQAGAIDYAWEYASIEATEDVQTVDLQPQVDLSRATAAFAEFYGNAEVEAGGETYVGAPIAYGITVPNVAEAPQAGAQFVELVLSQAGDGIVSDAGLQPINPAVVPTSAQQAVPKGVSQYVEAQDSLGPLELEVGHQPLSFGARTREALARTPPELAL